MSWEDEYALDDAQEEGLRRFANYLLGTFALCQVALGIWMMFQDEVTMAEDILTIDLEGWQVLWVGGLHIVCGSFFAWYGLTCRLLPKDPDPDEDEDDQGSSDTESTTAPPSSTHL